MLSYAFTNYFPSIKLNEFTNYFPSITVPLTFTVINNFVGWAHIFRGEGVLSGKVGHGDMLPRYSAFSASQVYQWPLFYLKIGLDIGRVFCKMLNFR